MTIDKVSEKIVSIIFSGNERYLKEVYAYGMSLILASTITTVFLLIIGLSIGCLVETVLFIICFSFLRIFTGGLHSKSYIMCNIYTIVIFLWTISGYIFFNDFCGKLSIYGPVMLLSILLIKKKAPIENTQKPIRPELYLFLKRKSLIVILSESIILFISELLGYTRMRIIFPTIVVNDVLMIIACFINYERRIFNEKMEHDD